MKISEVAKQLSKELKMHITEGTIRFYEKQGVFDFKREDNNYRDITQKDLVKLRKTFILANNGFGVPVIKAVVTFENNAVVGEVLAEFDIKTWQKNRFKEMYVNSRKNG